MIVNYNSVIAIVRWDNKEAMIRKNDTVFNFFFQFSDISCIYFTGLGRTYALDFAKRGASVVGKCLLMYFFIVNIFEAFRSVAVVAKE